MTEVCKGCVNGIEYDGREGALLKVKEQETRAWGEQLFGSRRHGFSVDKGGRAVGRIKLTI